MVRGVRKRRDRGLSKRNGCHLARKARRALRTEEATATRLTAGEVKNKPKTRRHPTGETKGYDMSESCVALGELIKARLLIDYNIKSSVKIVYGCSVAELKTTTCSTVVLLVSRDAAYKPPRDTTSRPTRRRRGGGKPVVVSTVPGGRLRRWRRRGGEGGGERESGRGALRPPSSRSRGSALRCRARLCSRGRTCACARQCGGDGKRK